MQTPTDVIQETTSTSKIKVQTTTPEMNGKVEEPQKEAALSQTQPKPVVMKVEEEVVPKEDKGALLFEELVLKIKDRNYELGECFTNNITYIALAENTLTWESCSDEACKKVLKHG